MSVPLVTRAPRLTARVLGEGLPELLECADDEIDYLASRLEDSGMFTLSPVLRERYQAKHDRLKRGREWLAGKIEAEQHHRAGN